MAFWSESRRLFKKVDKFATIELLRYKEETEYATYTGACLSVILVALMVLVAGNVIIDTLNRDKISSSTSIEVDPFPSNVTISLSTLKFGIQLVEADLINSTKSYFDVAVSEERYSNGEYSRVYYSVAPCKLEDWSVNSEI